MKQEIQKSKTETIINLNNAKISSAVYDNKNQQ
jgi:hypothetical protein